MRRQQPLSRAPAETPRKSRFHGVRRVLRAAGRSLVASAPDVGRFALLAGLSVLLTSFIFPPRLIWPLALVCLAPWALAVCRIDRPWVIHWGSFFAGWIFFLVNLSWLYPVTGLGYVALAFYLAMYWPAAAWAIRTARRAGIGVTWSLPVAWVACEFMRAWVMSGFPWLFLAHAFYKQLPLIQISDITGAYGVSFLAAMVNGLVVDLLLMRWRTPGEPSPKRRVIAAATATLLAMTGALLYGGWRLRTAHFVPGPKVAVVQEDFPIAVADPFHDLPFAIYARYLKLGALAAQSHPDIVAFPETVFSYPFNISFIEMERPAVDENPAQMHLFGSQYHRGVAAFARGDYATTNEVIAQLEMRIRLGAPSRLPPGGFPRLPAESGPPVTAVMGSLSFELYPDKTYPKQKKFNSALVYDRDGTQRRERYDKIHLVPFGEMVPFRNAKLLGFDLHWLYRLLNRLSPFSEGGKVEYSLWPGAKRTVFHTQAGDRVWRFGTPICYEDVMPYLVRGYVWDGPQRRVDFLINISNDGWFLHSAELPQHLAACVFRAVENRVGIARAVNTGMSGFIDPNGKVTSLVERDGVTLGPGITGFSVENVTIDDRESWYGRWGDAFASVCLVLTALLWLGAIITRWIFALRRRWLIRVTRPAAGP